MTAELPDLFVVFGKDSAECQQVLAICTSEDRANWLARDPAVSEGYRTWVVRYPWDADVNAFRDEDELE